MAKIFFVSDTHFNHARIPELERPQFIGDLGGMNEHLLDAWNSVVEPEDTVWHIGDVYLGECPHDVLSRLNGQKHLVPGNHDMTSSGKMKEGLEDYFTIHPQIVRLKLRKKHFVLCHFPFVYWEGSARGWYHLHGHTHREEDIQYRSMDVGVDCRDDMAPISLDSIFEALEGREHKDHHG